MIEVQTPHGKGTVIGKYPDGRYLVALPQAAPVESAHMDGLEYSGAPSRFGVYAEDELDSES